MLMIGNEILLSKRWESNPAAGIFFLGKSASARGIAEMSESRLKKLRGNMDIRFLEEVPY